LRFHKVHKAKRHEGKEQTMSINLSSGRNHNLRRIGRHAAGYLADVVGFVLAAVIAGWLRFDGAMPAGLLRPIETLIWVSVTANSLAFLLARVRWTHWRYTSIHDIGRIVLANSAGALLAVASSQVLPELRTIPRSIHIFDWMLCCLLTLTARLTVRLVVSAREANRPEGKWTPTLVYGAGAAGLALVQELMQNKTLMSEVVGLIDDDPRKADLVFKGKRVLGNGETLGAWVERHGIKKLLIAIPSATGPQLVRILKLATDAKIEFKMVPGLGDLVYDADLGKQIRDVAVEDLLGRKPVHLDLELIRERIHGRVVLVTGAAGSIGSEICRQVARFSPLALVGFDAAETPLFHLEREMAKTFPNLVFHPEIGSIHRLDTLQRLMQRHGPAIVYHAAAYKHVPMMERHVFAAVETNLFGTWNVARAASDYGVEDFVMISTDKAVRPTSMMGATKRAAELLLRSLQVESDTKFVAVRFGNVLGSNGSVIPIFKEQIAAGGPVTVTHPEMRRYFMTIPEAAQLVLQAFSIGNGGEIFVLDMGQPMKIADLAKSLVLLSGLQPDRDIEIKYTGLRPGEKMFEELNLEDERLVHTSHPKIRSYVSDQNLDAAHVRASLSQLRQIAERQDVAGLVLMLKDLIPDYNPGSELLKSVWAQKTNHSSMTIVPKHATATLLN
jgi:FlaA1/EpsC-like NDP-sugar epimerase